METKSSPQRLVWIFISISLVSFLGWFINTLSPNNTLSLGSFFVLIAIVSFAFSKILTHSKRTALLFSMVVTGFFVLRYLQLRELWYFFLLVIIAIALEVTLRKR